MGKRNPLLEKLGIDMKTVKIYKTVDQLLERTPFFVTGKAIRESIVTVDGAPIRIPKESVVVMPLDFFLSTRKTKKNIIQLRPYRKKFKDFFKRYKGQNLDGKKILIVRLGGIGDHLFSQPVCKYIKDNWPTSKIVYAAAPRYIPTFNSWPKGLVDAVIPVPFPRDILLNSDYHLFFEGSIERNLEARKVNAYDIFAKMAGLEIDQTSPTYYPELVTNPFIVDKLKSQLPKKYIVIQVRATSPLRMMGIRKWMNILSLLESYTDHNFLFLDQPEREGMFDKMIKHRNLNPERFFNGCRLSRDVEHAVNILAMSRGSIGIDSSFTHISAALGKPTIGIYAPFKGELRMKYYKNSAWVEPETSTCKFFPCFFHGEEAVNCKDLRNANPPRCFDGIDEDEVFEKVQQLF